MKRVIITVQFEAAVDDKSDASEAVGYVLDGGSMQDAIIEYAADHGCKIEITRSSHDVEAVIARRRGRHADRRRA